MEKWEAGLDACCEVREGEGMWRDREGKKEEGRGGEGKAGGNREAKGQRER